MTAAALVISLPGGWYPSASAEPPEASTAVASEAFPGDPAVPIASGTPLPFTASPSWGDIVVDEAHGQVFVSGGQDNTGVVVAALDGQILETIPGLAGAEGMILTEDGATLYVALADGKAIAAIDTETLVATTFSAGDGCPRHLAQLGAYVYFTESCAGSDFRLMRFDPVTGVVDPVTLAGEADQVFHEYGHIATHPSQSGRLFLVDNEFRSCCRPRHAVSAFEVDGLTATRAATRVVFDQYVYGLDFLTDGSELVVANGDGLTALAPSDLSVIRDTYPPSTFGTSFAVSASDSYLAWNRRDRIEVHDREGEYVRSYFFDEPTYLGINGVELAGSSVYAVTWHDDGSIRLHALNDVTMPAPYIEHSGPNETSADEPVHLPGTATLLGEPFAGHELEVWRRGVDGWVALPSVVTAADGSFVIEDMPGKGGYNYAVIYPGGPGIAPAKHQVQHTVSAVISTISLAQPDPSVFRPGDTISISGALTTRDGPIAGAVVTVTQTHDAQITTLPPVTTGLDGAFSFEATSEELGEHRFTAAFEGDRTYDGSLDTASVWVKQPASIELLQPRPYALMEEAMRFHGRLTTHDGQPVPNQPVSWGRYPSGWSTPQETRSATTDADGYFSFTDHSITTRVVRWRASYSGDATNDVAESETSLPVYSTIPAIDIRTNRAAHTYGSNAAVEAWLPEGATGGAVKLYAQPYGQPEHLLAEGSGTTGPDAVGSLRATGNATLAAVFEPPSGSYTYSPRRVTVPMSVRPRLQQTLLGSHGRQGKTYLVRTRTDPRLNLEVAPSLPGRCVRVHVERYRNNAYRAVRETACIPLNQDSRARWTLAVDPPAGVRYRLRYAVAGDEEFASARAPWIYLRFTR